MLYRFGEFELDAQKFELRQNGATLHVEPLVFDLVRCLAENAGKVMSRDDIIEQVWDGRIVSDATVSGCIKSARKTLGDSGDSQSIIRTVRGRGFQFVADVASCEAGNGHAPAAGHAGPTTAAEPSLIILPFQIFGDGGEIEAIADGLAENLTTVLTRVPLLSVTARSSSFALKGKAVSAADVRRDFGVDYMLEGSIQMLDDLVRANVQLIETENGFHLWAQQFDCPHEPDVMRHLLHDILPRLETQLVRAIFNSLGTGDGEMSSRQMLIKAMGTLSLKGWHRDSFGEASNLLRKSISKEPGLALSHAYLAIILGLGHRVGLLQKSESVVREAVEEAETALKLDNMDSNVLGLAGCALADVGQPDRAIPLLRKAVDINPNNAQAWSALGSAQLINGLTDDAIHNLQHGIEISPMDNRLSVWQTLLSIAHLQSGDLDQALAAAQAGCQSDDLTYLPRVLLAATHLARGEKEDATMALRECHRVKPDLSEREMQELVGPKLAAALKTLRQSN
ncbi:MAG: winged helix-turn-helix domain-containing protein [Hyphomicrobiaceae bacterium]